MSVGLGAFQVGVSVIFLETFPVQALHQGETHSLAVPYTIIDADGDNASAILTIKIDGTGDGIIIADDNGAEIEAVQSNTKLDWPPTRAARFNPRHCQAMSETQASSPRRMSSFEYLVFKVVLAVNALAVFDRTARGEFFGPLRRFYVNGAADMCIPAIKSYQLLATKNDQPRGNITAFINGEYTQWEWSFLHGFLP